MGCVFIVSIFVVELLRRSKRLLLGPCWMNRSGIGYTTKGRWLRNLIMCSVDDSVYDRGICFVLRRIGN